VRGCSEGRLGDGFSWTVQPFPSGSLKKQNEFHGSPWPSSHSPSTMCRTGVMSSPRPTSSARAASMSVTHSWRPWSVPGSIFARPLPIEIEQAEPGGVSWTTRKSSFGWWSTSTTKPHWLA
jgi:hypothetical protein